MNPKIGDVIDNENGLFIITNIENRVISGMEMLECYMSKNTMIQVNNEWITIQDFILANCEQYLKSGIQVIKE